MSKFSEYLLKRKEELDLSFADISRLTGNKVSKSYLIQMVAEKRSAPKPEKLKALAPACKYHI
jgi:cyanate lyase